MNERELKTLAEAVRRTGLDPHDLQVKNPFTLSGTKAESLQVAVSEVDPVQAAEWKAAAGDGGSLAYALNRAGLMETTERTHRERMELDGDYIESQAQKTAQWEQEMLSNMEAAALRARQQLNDHLMLWGGGKKIRDEAGGGGRTIGQQLQQAADEAYRNA